MGCSWSFVVFLMVITCIWNVCLFKICSLSIVICSRYRPSHDDWACQKCDISRSCYCLWFLRLLLLERIVSSIGMCFFIFQCMYMYLWSVNEIDAWAALTSQIRVVYHTFKQTIIYSICIENLKYRQVDIQTNKKNITSNHHQRLPTSGNFSSRGDGQ